MTFYRYSGSSKVGSLKVLLFVSVLAAIAGGLFLWMCYFVESIRVTF